MFIQNLVPLKRPLIFLLFIFGLLLGTTAVFAATSKADTATTPTPLFQQFQPITPQIGWLLDQNDLWLTNDAGENWQTITPQSIEPHERIVSIDFLNKTDGWLLTQTTNTQGEAQLQLWQTSDSGQTWQTNALALFDPGDIDAHLSSVQLFMLDTEQGWLATKRGTSSNFSIGTLFYTEDSGQTWDRRTLPSGEPIYFIDQQHGWLVGSPSQDTLYHTDDGGQTWETQSLEVEPEENIQYLYMPTFNDAGSGQLHAMLLHKGASRLARYTTSDYGKTWTRTAQYDLGSDWGDSIPLAQIDEHQWLYVRPGTHELASNALNLDSLNPSTRVPEGLQQIIMLNAFEGWAKQIVTTCGSATCQQSTNLWRTEDGGQTWTQFNTPISYQQVINLSPDSAPTTQQVTTMVGQGFDKCEIPTLSQLQNWYSNSPYRAVNLYIGGSSRACGNGALSASYLQQLSQQGWKFIPTWVGPQAACSGYGSRMSNDPATAYNQGKAEANQAISVASNLGLTNGGTIIYYDLEGYPNDAACRNAAKSFISGWTYQLAQAGHKAGAYGSACASYVSDWATGSSVPEAIWPAAWYASSYDANASVSNVPCIDNGNWVNNQRIRQYAGGHNEAWGGVTLNIDSNAIRSSVATISTGGGGNPTEVILEDPTQLQYPYNNGCAGSGWERYVNDRGHYAYLTLNTNQPSQSTNWAEWRTTLPTTGQWRVYAYIPDHPVTYWSCLNNKRIDWDTIESRYTIYHANGSSTVPISQKYLYDAWLDLGSFTFSSSQQARIRLTDLNGQPNLSETISVSALRFVYQPASPTPTPPPPPTPTPPPPPPPPPPQNAKTLNVRYVDQVYAQENSAGGYWILCGPSSAAMLLHYEGKESRDVFTNRQATRDLCGMMSSGNCNSGYTVFAPMIDILNNKGVNAYLYWAKPTFAQIKQSIDRNHPVITSLNVGHIVTIVGYNATTEELVIHDPFGRKNWWDESENWWRGATNMPPANAPKTVGRNISYKFSEISPRIKGVVFVNNAVSARQSTVANWNSTLNNGDVTINLGGSARIADTTFIEQVEFTPLMKPSRETASYHGTWESFVISASDNSGAEIHNSPEPFSVEINFDEDWLRGLQVTTGVVSESESNLQVDNSSKRVRVSVIHWDADQQAWFEVNSNIDFDTDMISFNSQSFGEYALAFKINSMIYLPVVQR